MKKIILALAFLALSPLAALAANWASVGSTSEDQVAFYVDMDNLSRESKVVTFWELAEPLPAGFFEGYPTSRSMKVQRAINCDTHEVKQLQVYIYDGDKKQLESLTAPPDEHFEAIVPDSMNDLEQQMLCQ